MSRKLPFTFKEFKSIYSKVPRLCVDLVVKTEQGVLLTLRLKNGYIGLWHLPGGTVLFREFIEKAIVRVAKEELGIKVSIDKLLGYIEYFSEERERGFGYTVSLVFLCKPLDAVLQLDDQVKKADFFQVIPKNTIEEQKEFLTKHLGLR